MHKKKAQAWGFDLLVGTSVFLLGLIAFLLFSLNYSSDSEEKISSLEYQASKIGEDLLSEGNPENWNLTNVKKIGLMSNNRLNQTKLNMFYNLSLSDYRLTKNLFNVEKNYFFYLSEPIYSEGNLISGIGIKNESSKNIIKITRLIIYDNKTVSAYIEIWE